MECNSCHFERLSHEFPHPHTECKHLQNVCLECVHALIKTKKLQCPTCEVPWNSSRVADLRAQLQAVSISLDVGEQKQITVVDGNVNVTLLDGRSFVLPFTGATTLASIRAIMSKHIGVEPNKQRFILNRVELQNSSLVEQGVRAGCTLLLVVLMLAVSHLRGVKFHLTWRFPRGAQGYSTDYLDGSCLLYSGSTFLQHVDYEWLCCDGIVHSGDVMDDTGGTHTMTVNLPELSREVTQLYFVLSAFHCPTLGCFGQPKVALTNAADNAPLCDYQVYQAANSQAVVMCYLSRVNGNWEVFQAGMPSSGTVRDYTAMMRTIESQLCKRAIAS